MEKRNKLILLVFILLLVGVIMFVFINDRAEAPVQFKGPVGDPYTKGPTIPSPAVKN
ncbi:MAG: hypothetical protein AB1333_00500 [Patescibacteria group bacterium]